MNSENMIPQTSSIPTVRPAMPPPKKKSKLADMFEVPQPTDNDIDTSDLFEVPEEDDHDIRVDDLVDLDINRDIIGGSSDFSDLTTMKKRKKPIRSKPIITQNYMAGFR